jgi:hypothetical protein
VTLNLSYVAGYLTEYGIVAIDTDLLSQPDVTFRTGHHEIIGRPSMM